MNEVYVGLKIKNNPDVEYVEFEWKIRTFGESENSQVWGVP